MSSIFETYYSLAEIAQRIPKSGDFWRAELKAGKFQGDCVFIGGEYFVPASGVAHYLDAHKLGAAPLSEMVNGRARQDVEDRAPLSFGTPARSAGELRRKLVQAPGQEATHG